MAAAQSKRPTRTRCTNDEPGSDMTAKRDLMRRQRPLRSLVHGSTRITRRGAPFSIALAAVLAGTVLVVACAEATVKPRGAGDPASPASSETPYACESASASSMTATAAIPDASSSIYSCPMHPQIFSGTPGTCPVCGMPFRRRDP
jgi:hypothetical protein